MTPCSSDANSNEFVLGCVWADACDAGLLKTRSPIKLNELEILLVPALALLNCTLRVKRMVKFSGYYNLSDPRSLPSVFRSGAMDTVDGSLIVNANRWGVLNFAYPHSFSQLMVALKRPPLEVAPVSFAFLLRPFDRGLWISTAIVLYIFLILAYLFERCRFMRRLRFIVLFGVLFDVCVAIICTLYSTGLKATAVGAPAFSERPTFELLSRKVAAGELVLVTDRLIDWRFEFINSSSSTDVRAFREALAHNPPLLVNSSEVCGYLERSSTSGSYFVLGSKDEVVYFCEERLLSKNIELLLIPVPDAPAVMDAFVFSSAAEPVRQRVSSLAIHGLYVAEDERATRYMKASRIMADDDNEQRDDRGNDEAIYTRDIASAFGVLIVGLVLAAFVLAIEKRFPAPHTMDRITISKSPSCM